MGVSREEAAIALENIEHPDQNLAMDWIEQNQDRMDQIILERAQRASRE